jgi:hypothetical protein
MDKKAVAERLRALVLDDEKRSKAARLREVLPEVEAALAAGARRSDVLAALAANGLTMSLSTFETTLKRLRAKRAGVHIKPAHTQPSPPPRVLVSTLQTNTVKSVRQASHDPADLDRIITTQPDLNALAKLAKRKNR